MFSGDRRSSQGTRAPPSYTPIASATPKPTMTSTPTPTATTATNKRPTSSTGVQSLAAKKLTKELGGWRTNKVILCASCIIRGKVELYLRYFFIVFRNCSGYQETFTAAASTEPEEDEGRCEIFFKTNIFSRAHSPIYIERKWETHYFHSNLHLDSLALFCSPLPLPSSPPHLSPPHLPTAEPAKSVSFNLTSIPTSTVEPIAAPPLSRTVPPPSISIVPLDQLTALGTALLSQQQHRARKDEALAVTAAAKSVASGCQIPAGQFRCVRLCASVACWMPFPRVFSKPHVGVRAKLTTMVTRPLMK